MWETQVLPLGWEDPVEKEMETHDSILAWRIPWMEAPGGLHGHQGHKESDTTELFTTERLYFHFKSYPTITVPLLDFPDGSDGKASATMWETWVPSLPSGRSPGEGNGNPLQYSCLEDPMGGGPWQITAHGVAKSWT